MLRSRKQAVCYKRIMKFSNTVFQTWYAVAQSNRSMRYKTLQIARHRRKRMIKFGFYRWNCFIQENITIYFIDLKVELKRNLQQTMRYIQGKIFMKWKQELHHRKKLENRQNKKSETATLRLRSRTFQRWAETAVYAKSL
eukprot:763431-Hanusia_phi.AAC.1